VVYVLRAPPSLLTFGPLTAMFECLSFVTQ
jgi:hypothetical protein